MEIGFFYDYNSKSMISYLIDWKSAATAACSTPLSNVNRRRS